MKPLYDELSLPISITITDRERIFRWGRTHRSHERFTRPKWDPSYHYPSSADCTTATNDGLPERARIKPCRYWLSDFLVRRVMWIVVCQKSPMGVREGILKTDSWEETLRGTPTPE